MGKPDDFLDDDAVTANRSDMRSAVIITVVALATVVAASMVVVLGGVIP